MFRKLLWLIFAIGFSGGCIYGLENFLMADYREMVSNLIDKVQDSSSEVQNTITPFLGKIMNGASYAARGFAALIGISIANVIFGK